MNNRMTRTMESRSATVRPPIGGEPKGRLEIDVSSLPSDIEPTWIREETLGQYDNDNVMSAMERGYKPVLTTDLPTYQSFRLPGAPERAHESGDASKIIRRGGMVLMGRSRESAQAERDSYAAETKQVLKSVARDTAAPKDGRNFKDMPPEVSTSFEAKGRFSE